VPYFIGVYYAHKVGMNTQKLIDSKPPKSYNQEMWLSMSQRMAWLLQRWLNKGNGDPYYYFELLKTSLFISDETELNTLFTGDFYQGEQFITRYIDECFWIIWRVNVEEAQYFFVLCADHFYQGSFIIEYSFPYKFDKGQLTAKREQVETLLIDLYLHGSRCKFLQKYRQVDSIKKSQAVYAELAQDADTQTEQLNLYHQTSFYQVQLIEITPDSTATMQEQKMWDQDLYITAWNFASKAHSKQFMPGSDIPYVNHIGLVAMEVMSAICQPQTEKMALYQPIKNANLAIVCALLHDTIEDTEISFNDIVKHFDEAIAYGVLALTKDKKLPNKQEQMLDSLQRIKQQPLEVGMVKLADRITNLQSPPHYWTKEKIKNYCLEAQNILNALGHANEYLAQRLAYKIKNYQQYCL
jgi:hypothetical protein